MILENLTKENFWNEMTELYPVAMKKFYEWIDKYKEENNWKKMFGEHVLYEKEDFPYTPTMSSIPKYHELPLAFQYGIFVQFIGEIYVEDEVIGRDEIREGFIEFITHSLKLEEE